MVSGIAQTFTFLSDAKPGSAPENEKGAVPQNAAPVASKESESGNVDTVSISDQSRQAIIADAKKDEAKRENPDKGNNDENSGGATAKVQFVYNPEGNLSIRYMDTTSRLIYQVPSELMLRLQEAVLKSHSSVDTKAYVPGCGWIAAKQLLQVIQNSAG
jgi:hypothetical protein